MNHGETEKREALAVGCLLLEQEQGAITKALYQLYLHHRTLFLDQEQLMDTSTNDTDPYVIQAWNEVRMRARGLEDSVRAHWAAAILHSHEQRNHSLSEQPVSPAVATKMTTCAGRVEPIRRAAETALQDQLEQDAIAFGVNEIRGTHGDLPQTLHNLHRYLIARVSDPRGVVPRARGALNGHYVAAETLTNFVNDHWAAAIVASRQTTPVAYPELAESPRQIG
jgi:hypothetical protein